MCSNLSDCHLKTDCCIHEVLYMVTRSQKPLRDTQKIKRNKNTTLKKVIKPKGRQQQKKTENYKTTRKQQNGNIYLLTITSNVDGPNVPIK